MNNLQIRFISLAILFLVLGIVNFDDRITRICSGRGIGLCIANISIS